VRGTAPRGVVKHGRQHLCRLGRRLLVERGQSGTSILCSTGIPVRGPLGLPACRSAVSSRGIPVRSPLGLPACRSAVSRGGIPVRGPLGLPACRSAVSRGGIPVRGPKDLPLLIDGLPGVFQGKLGRVGRR
jgi:hypothetical protein